jgi:predicted transposase YbfD/YdcC
MRRLPTPDASLLVVHHFAQVPDPRQAHKIDHPLSVILLIAFAAVLCGIDRWDGMEDFARERLPWLQTLVPGLEKVPSADTFRRVFDRLRPAAFAGAFDAWSRALAGSLRGEQLAIDGKSALGAVDPEQPSRPLHRLHVFAVRKRLLVASASVGGAPEEPAAVPEALALLAMRGAVATADANFCNRAVAEAVTAEGADYVLTLKANRGAQHAEVEAAFAAHDAGTLRGARADLWERGEQAHGREDFRRVVALPAHVCPRIQAHYPGVRSVAALLRLRRKDGRLKVQRSYAISSLEPDAQRLGRYVRRHWSVENHLHHALDVVLHEDACPVAKGPAAENLATVRRLALTRLRQDTSNALSLPRRVRKAMLNPEYLRHLLTLSTS